MINTQSAPPFPDLPRGRKPADVPSPTWRWELAMAGCRLSGETIDTVTELYEDHPAWNDPVLRRYVLPTIRKRLGQPVDRDDACLQDDDTFRFAYNDWRYSRQHYNQTVERMEVAILTGAAPGEGVSFMFQGNQDAPRLYEALYFDIRPWRVDREWMIDRYFHNMLSGRNYRLEAGFIAYSLGLLFYDFWRRGHTFDSVYRMLNLIKFARERAQCLGRHARDVTPRLLAWLLRQGDRLCLAKRALKFPDKALAASPDWETFHAIYARDFPALLRGPITIPWLPKHML